MTRAVRRTSEAAFQRQVLQLAEFYGWQPYHTHDSRRSHPGFPDLVLVRGVDLLFAELKTDTGRLRPAQAVWVKALQVVAEAIDAALDVASRASGAHRDSLPHVEVHVWRPADFDELHRRLGHGRHLQQPLYRDSEGEAA